MRFSVSGALIIAAALMVLLLGLSVNLHAGVWLPLEAYEAQHPAQFGSLLGRTDPAMNVVVITGLSVVLLVIGIRRFAGR